MLRSQLDEHRREMDEVKAALAASYQEVRRRQHAVPATAVVKAAVRTLPLGHAVDYCTRCGVTAAWDCTALHCAAQQCAHLQCPYVSNNRHATERHKVRLKALTPSVRGDVGGTLHDALRPQPIDALCRTRRCLRRCLA
jgi:hypothetical protein